MPPSEMRGGSASLRVIAWMTLGGCVLRHCSGGALSRLPLPSVVQGDGAGWPLLAGGFVGGLAGERGVINDLSFRGQSRDRRRGSKALVISARPRLRSRCRLRGKPVGAITERRTTCRARVNDQVGEDLLPNAVRGL